MANRMFRAVCCVLVLMAMTFSPLVSPAAAHSSILLSVDVQHAVLEPGQSLNITLTIENNASSIESYNVSVDASQLASPWTVTALDTTVDNVFPTWTKNTTLVVRLAEGATVADSGSFTINVTEPDSGASSVLTVLASVAPSYHPSLSSVASPLVKMAAGSSTNVSFLAHNLGTVEDTFLLDVEVQPDLASWWANHTNTSGNSSETGGSGTSTNNSSSPPTPSVSALMMGNSYTNANSLDTLVEGVATAAGYNASVDALTGGGMKLPAHWQNVDTAGHQWNTTLRNSAWDYVVLQDQSQVPTFPTSNSVWQDSKNASVNLSNAIASEGAETVLFMTWGYRSGDSLNSFNNNFTNMQARLSEGYTRYAENISSTGNDVWIAPVGLAYKTVHDGVVAEGDDPTASGNLFYDLYTSDGSHPSLSGSYLAACVLHSTMTGDTCVGSNDTVSLSAAVKLSLQQAADDTVFNQTAGMSYYPWEAPSATAFGLGSSVPAGWYLQWQDDELANIAAGGSASATLSITVPSNAAPDFYGYRLTIGSTNGNITSSTIIVVEVESEPAITTAFLRQSDVFLPGQSTLTAVQVSNTGNSPLDIDWALSMPPGVTSSACTGSLVSAQSLGLQSGAVTDAEMMIDVAQDSDSSDTCPFRLTATHDVDDTTQVLDTFDFSIDVDELVNFSLSGPLSIVDINPSVGQNYEIRLTNHGSDEAMFFLDIDESASLDTVLVTVSGITIPAGETGTWTVNTKGDADQSGVFLQAFSSSYSGITSSLQVPINLLEVAGLQIVPPSEDRVLVAPGSSAQMSVLIRNTGTSNLSLQPTLSGLPTGVTVAFDKQGLSLNRAAETTVVLTFTAAPGATPGTSPVSLSYLGETISAAYDFDMVVVDREAVSVSSINNRLLATPSSITALAVDVTNLGTSTEMFQVEWLTQSQGNWFEFNITPTTFTLDAGISQQISITVREVASGAPDNGVVYTLRVVSTTNSAVSDSFNLTVESVEAGAAVNMQVIKDSAKPGENVYGTLTVENTGEADDTFSVVANHPCEVNFTVFLEPGGISSPVTWTCTVEDDALAGTAVATVSATSAVRSDVSDDSSVLYTVEASWPAEARVALNLSESRVSLGIDSSSVITVTVLNLGNAEISGSLTVSGQDTGLLVPTWVRLADGVETDAYTLAPYGRATYSLNLTSNTARTASPIVEINADSSGDGTPVIRQVLVTIEGPAIPPNGLALPMDINVSQNTALSVMGAGWLLALVAIQLLRRSRRSESTASEDDEASPADEDEKELPELGYNECRLDANMKVDCPKCEARLGVPRGSSPPFRFTCPQCSEKIRVVE